MPNDLTKLPSFRTLDEWSAGLRWLLAFKKNWQWIFGTHLNRGKEKFQDQIWQYVHFDDMKYSHGYIANIMSVCKAIGDQYTPEIDNWSFWEAIAPMTPGERDPIITRALKNGGVHRDEIRALKAGTNGNGVTPQQPQTELQHLEGNLAQAYVTVGRLLQRGEGGQLTVNALDELIDAAMAIRGKIHDRLKREVQ